MPASPPEGGQVPGGGEGAGGAAGAPGAAAGSSAEAAPPAAGAKEQWRPAAARRPQELVEGRLARELTDGEAAQHGLAPSASACEAGDGPARALASDAPGAGGDVPGDREAVESASFHCRWCNVIGEDRTDVCSMCGEKLVAGPWPGYAEGHLDQEELPRALPPAFPGRKEAKSSAEALGAAVGPEIEPCARGDQCRPSRRRKRGGGGDQEALEVGAVGGGGQEAPKVCFGMRDKGTCVRGDQCRFSHDRAVLAADKEARKVQKVEAEGAKKGKEARKAAAAVCAGAAATPPSSASASSARSKGRPTIRVGDTVLAPWGLERDDFDESVFCEGRVSALHDDGSLEVSFTGQYEGWVEPRVPRGRYIWVMLESDRARFDGVEERVGLADDGVGKCATEQARAGGGGRRRGR